MKKLYVIANPQWYKNFLNIELKHNEYKDCRLVFLVASDCVPMVNDCKPFSVGVFDDASNKNSMIEFTYQESKLNKTELL